MLKAYKYELLPDESQRQLLAQYFGASRLIYNLGLSVKISAWETLGKRLSCYDLTAQFTELRNSGLVDWIKVVPSQAMHSALKNLDAAYSCFFRGGGFPKFKRRSNRQSVHFRENSKVVGNKIRLTKIGWLEFIKHRPLGEGQIRTVVVSKIPTGKYFVSILIECGNLTPDKKPISETTSVGIDMGLKSFVVLSDGQIFDNPKYLNHQLSRLRIEQRKLQRRFKKGARKQSKGWQKQKLVVAKLHEKITNQRKDFLHKTSTAIVKQFNTICLENLNIAGMVKNRKLSAAISDVGWGEFVRMVEYKAGWYGNNVIRIGRFAPSSKTCSTCGNINQDLTLSIREWTCENCGTTHDRDLNAARNIKKIGLEAKPSLANVA
jgi:putative transposase